MAVKVIVRVAPVFVLPEIRLNQDLIEAFHLLIHLLQPASMAAFLLAFWRFGADLGWTSDFLISDGLWSHWQLWAFAGLSMLAGQSWLTRRFLRA
jgi:hypothetical protein